MRSGDMIMNQFSLVHIRLNARSYYDSLAFVKRGGPLNGVVKLGN